MNLLETALSQFGVQEIPGAESNPVIVRYAKDIGYGAVVLTENTAWCSIFMNWCALKAGLERSGKLNARSWLNFGEEINSPQLGDVVIYWRGEKDGWKGHVGIYITEDKDSIFTLGGNQGNMVKISPYNKARVLGYRRLNIL